MCPCHVTKVDEEADLVEVEPGHIARADALVLHQAALVCKRASSHDVTHVTEYKFKCSKNFHDCHAIALRSSCTTGGDFYIELGVCCSCGGVEQVQTS